MSDLSPTVSQHKHPRRTLALIVTAVFALSGMIGLGFYMNHLSNWVRPEFEGRRWALPARVYARPLEIFPGMNLTAKEFVQELELAQYRFVSQVDTPGSVEQRGNVFRVITRPFRFPDSEDPAQFMKIVFGQNMVETIQEAQSGQAVPLLRFDPARIAGIYPTQKEDRLLIKFSEVPELLIQTLVAVEDQGFFEHHGIDLQAIGRAFLVNLAKRQMAQGASTLTQQLVKNFFLTPEKTLRRKLDEVLISLILEYYYSKQDILEAYLNEVYLGQDGERSIHGFGQASQFYFGRPLTELKPHQIALMTGMLKAPSTYNPRRFPQNALQRRNTVLQIMSQENLIDSVAYDSWRHSPLDVTSTPPSGRNQFPAFVDLVKRQLIEDYPEESLRSEGLNIFTTLEPRYQRHAEQTVIQELRRLEKKVGFPTQTLNQAIILVSTDNGEIQALTGGKNPYVRGFNPALDAFRPIGSLIKPFIYLTAFQHPDKYNIVTLLDDSPLNITLPNHQFWKPNNYDRQFHGMVPAWQALAHSYNIPAVRLGMAVGLTEVRQTLRYLGWKRDVDLFPSSLLGSIELSPLEVARLYQPLASQGFVSPLRTIRAVYTQDHTLLKRYPLTSSSPISPEAVYLLNVALQAVVKEGTAAALKNWLHPDYKAAGKTGTTNELKDSWFAGFTGNHLAVVWVGRDDNQSARLTGSSGALPLWGKLMAKVENLPLEPPIPANVEWVAINSTTGNRIPHDCEQGMLVPFVKNYLPPQESCSEKIPETQPERTVLSPPPGALEEKPSGIQGVVRWFKKWFE
ncbi:MAG: penicillin-binding protein 1B [SAR324 cluster bacterium]|nr:penicillin-binding protein 1B [SAR324 cluster bacterium]